MDGKITLVTHRGTKTTRIDVKTSPWAGKSFQNEQIKRMSSIPSKESLLMKRGTKSVSVSKYPEFKKMQSLEGYLICCGRGTSSRRL
ncbi:hypothetical protein [Nitrosopumilus sp. b1]|uniref:hypothetical protein n=1 Tax=Nitrosopumilus sp. b1 TaxID=2109907 RepID=UPI0015F5FB91|nr:hypothetical protein [Nitrosopumilus sp. b1]